jgi:hypothetical protein
MIMLPDGAVVSHPYVSYEGGTRVLVVSPAPGAEAWYRIERWGYAVQWWTWQADARSMREVPRYVRPGELVDADSAELWANVNPRMPAYIARARLACAGRPLKLQVADSEQLREWQYDPYAPKGEDVNRRAGTS